MMFRPRFISFDCHGTLINPGMGEEQMMRCSSRFRYGANRLTGARQLPVLLGPSVTAAPLAN